MQTRQRRDVLRLPWAGRRQRDRRAIRAGGAWRHVCGSRARASRPVRWTSIAPAPTYCPHDRCDGAPTLTEAQAIERARALLPREFCGPDAFVTGLRRRTGAGVRRVADLRPPTQDGRAAGRGDLTHLITLRSSIAVGNYLANIPGTELGAQLNRTVMRFSRSSSVCARSLRPRAASGGAVSAYASGLGQLRRSSTVQDVEGRVHARVASKTRRQRAELRRNASRLPVRQSFAGPTMKAVRAADRRRRRAASGSYDRDLNQVIVRKLDLALGATPAGALAPATTTTLDRFHLAHRGRGGNDGLRIRRCHAERPESQFTRVRIGFRDSLPRAMRAAP